MVKVYGICNTCKGNHYEELEHHTVLCRTCKGTEEVIKDTPKTDHWTNVKKILWEYHEKA